MLGWRGRGPWQGGQDLTVQGGKERSVQSRSEGDREWGPGQVAVREDK